MRAYREIFLMVWMAIFLLLLLLPYEYFPAKWSFDSMKISGEIDYYDIEGSFRTTRSFLYVIGDLSAIFWVLLAGVGWIYVTSRYINSAMSFLVVSLFFVPVMLLNTIWPAKETIVMLIALLVVFLWTRLRINMILLVFISYAIYGYFFRSYYFVILALFLFLCLGDLKAIYQGRVDNTGWFFARSKHWVWYLSAFCVAAFAMPESFYEYSQGQREVSNAYALLEGSYNQTAFDNIADVGRGLAFIKNYFWAMLNLLLPFVVGFGLNQILLFLFSVFCIYILYFSSVLSVKRNVFSYLFLSHMLVLFLFEPDQGSYFRHILSVVLYLMPVVSDFEFSKYKKECV